MQCKIETKENGSIIDLQEKNPCVSQDNDTYQCVSIDGASRKCDLGRIYHRNLLR